MIYIMLTMLTMIITCGCCSLELRVVAVLLFFVFFFIVLMQFIQILSNSAFLSYEICDSTDCCLVNFRFFSGFTHFDQAIQLIVAVRNVFNIRLLRNLRGIF